jgi:phosphatidylinositol dimannoside acyltransferase
LYEWIGKVTGNERKRRQLAALSRRLPGSFLLFLCRASAFMLYGLAGKNIKRTVLSNMSDLLPGRTPRELQRYRYRYFENIVITLYELLMESFGLEESAARRFQVEGEEHLSEALRRGRGAIVYTPHVGNFFYYYWYLCQNYSCLTVVTAGSPELRPLYLTFQPMGCTGLDYDETPPLELFRKLRRHLQAGGVVFLLGDFWRPSFPRSRFFGRVTRTPDGAATLSIDQLAPVIPFYGWREQGFTHRLRFEPALHLYASYSKATRSDATKVLNRFMERVIRERPEEWFYWFNAQERWEEEQEPEMADAAKESSAHTA